MFTGGCETPNADLSTALPQPMFGLKMKIHAIAIRRPGIASGTTTSQAATSTQATSVTVTRMSPPSKQSVERALPLLLFVGIEQDADDLLRGQRLDHAGRVDRHVGPGRQAAEFCEEALAFP